MIENFNLDELPSVELLAKEQLPTTAGIYFAVDSNDRFLYIGKAQNINKRWANHHRYDQLKRINKKNSIKLKWYECKNNKEILTKLENYFIDRYDPVLNQTKVEEKKFIPAEISLRKTLVKISKYVIIYGYEEAIKWFGGYEILGLQEADYLSRQTNYAPNAPKWFKPHKVIVRIPEGDKYRSLSAPISAATHAELEQRLEQIKKLSPLHQRVRLQR